MERRNFLKSLLGIVAVPSICAAKLSKGTQSKNVNINFNNIKINGTFDGWIESIRAEIERLLKPVNQGDEKYLVTVISGDWGSGKPVKSIVVSDKWTDLGWFSLAKHEFNQPIKNHKKYLTRLVEVRFTDMLWSMSIIIEDRYKALKRFDPKWEIGSNA